MDIKKLLQNKMFKILLGVIGAIVLLIIVIMIVFAIRGTRVSGYAVLEEKMVAAARAYYKENSDKLPKEVGGKSEVDHTTLTAEGHLKNLQNISPKGSTCTGRVIVKNVNHGYFYQAFLDCGDRYKTTTLANYIKSHESMVSTGEGLYEYLGSYIYRGENPRNYIKLGDRLYQIVQLNDDGTIQIISRAKDERVVWDNRYNETREETDGINDYRLSRIRDSLLDYMNSNTFNDKQRNMLEPYSLCIGKVAREETVSLGMECSDVLEGQVAGILPVSSYTYASLDPACKTVLDGSCQNYNYLEVDYNWWTSTAVADNTYQVYSVGKGAYYTKSVSNAYIREYLRLTENTVYVSGEGTFDKPYIIK